MCIGFKLGGDVQSTHADDSLRVADNASVGFPGELVLMWVYERWCGSIMNTPGDEASHPPAAIPPRGLLIPFEGRAFHRGYRRLKPRLSPSLNG